MEGFRVEIEQPQVQEMRSSAKLVYSTLKDADDRLTSREIADQVHLHERTVRGALADLESCGVVVSSRSTRDARKLVYEVCFGEDSPD